MSHQPTHHHSSLNSISPVPQPIKPENTNDNGNDVVLLPTVPKVPHTPEEYDPECKCSTCQLATKLMAECTCGECLGKQQTNQVNEAEGNVAQSSKNIKIPSPVAFSNAQPSEESGDSSSDDEDDDSVDDEDDDKELVSQESESDDDSSDPEYAFSRPSTSKAYKKSNAKGQFGKYIKKIDSKKSHKCSSCNQCFANNSNLNRHYREVHQMLNRNGSVKTNGDCLQCGRNVHPQLKSHLLSHKKPGFRCAWPKCGFFYSKLSEAKKHICADHLQVETANSQLINQHLVKVNPSTGKTGKVNHYKSSTAFNSNCPKCGRNFRNGGRLKKHVRAHTKSGFRCTWRVCGFFFSHHDSAKQHTLKEHFKDKLVNSTQLNQYLLKVHAKPVKRSDTK